MGVCMFKVHILTCLVLFIGVITPKASSAANFGGEIYLSPSFGGTDFNESNPHVDHKRSWDFFFNVGVALGVRASVSTDIFTFGVGADLGWKEEAIEHRPSGGAVSEYDYQQIRALVGPYITWGKIVHLYVGYDPLAYAKFTYTDNEHVNPFRKGDTLTGYGGTIGVGVKKDDVLIRFLGRKIFYNKAELSDVEIDLPSSEVSKMNTGEFVIQVGQTF